MLKEFREKKRMPMMCSAVTPSLPFSFVCAALYQHTDSLFEANNVDKHDYERNEHIKMSLGSNFISCTLHDWHRFAQ